MAEFEPRDPQWAARVQDAFRRDTPRRRTLLEPLNATLEDAAPGRVVMALDWPGGAAPSGDAEDGGMVDAGGGGMVDAGIAAAVLSLAGELAALSLAAPGVRIVPVEHKVNFAAGPPSGNPAPGKLTAVGEVTQSGRTITVGRVRLYAAGPEGSEAPALAQMLATYLAESAE